MKSQRRIRISFNAPLTIGIVAVSFAATGLMQISGESLGRLFFMTYRSSLASPLTYVRAFLHVFGHADWNHLIGNMGYLLLLGPMLEEKHSSAAIAKVVAITAIATSVANFVLAPNTALCGASGVVFAFMILASFTSFKGGEIPITVVLVAVIFLGQQILDGITVQDNVSNMAHIVGGVVGGISGYILNKKEK